MNDKEKPGSRNSGKREKLGSHLQARGNMIKCRKPVFYEPQGGWELENGVEERPIIVILDPRTVHAALQLRRNCFEPVAARLERLLKIRENGYLELPDVRYGSFGGVVFRQGRHRTTALAKLGFSAYPVVTSDGHASRLLEKFGASVDEARRHFDWREIVDYPVMGF